MSGDAIDDPSDVPAGETRHLRHPVGETYLGDPVEVPVSILNGEHEGPSAFLTAAIHGDELNGVKVCQEVVARYDPSDLHGTLVCVHVVNVPGYQAQQRYLPIYDQDLNRSFPGGPRATTAERLAHEVYETFLAPCDLGIDLHTSTRNRTTMYHVRADMRDAAAARLADAFGANVVLDGPGEPASLRGVATAAGTPTVTVEMGRAHRFQRSLIDRAVAGVESVLTEFGLRPDGDRLEPHWRRILGGDQEKRWLRADRGGLVEMLWGPVPLVEEGEPICSIADHFLREVETVHAPFTGIVVGFLENPVALPGHPLCHLARIDEETHGEIRTEIERGEFDGYTQMGLRYLGAGEEAE